MSVGVSSILRIDACPDFRLMLQTGVVCKSHLASSRHAQLVCVGFIS